MVYYILTVTGHTLLVTRCHAPSRRKLFAPFRFTQCYTYMGSKYCKCFLFAYSSLDKKKVLEFFLFFSLKMKVRYDCANFVYACSAPGLLNYQKDRKTLLRGKCLRFIKCWKHRCLRRLCTRVNLQSSTSEPTSVLDLLKGTVAWDGFLRVQALQDPPLCSSTWKKRLIFLKKLTNRNIAKRNYYHLFYLIVWRVLYQSYIYTQYNLVNSLPPP
jgi:hypothetical protein